MIPISNPASCAIFKIPAAYHFCDSYIVFWKKVVFSVVFRLTDAIIICPFCNWFKKQAWRKAFACYYVDTEISET